MKNIILFDLPKEKLDNMTCMLCGGPAEEFYGHEHTLHGSEGNIGPRQFVVYFMCSICSQEVRQDKQSAVQLVLNIEKEVGKDQPQIPTPPSMN